MYLLVHIFKSAFYSMFGGNVGSAVILFGSLNNAGVGYSESDENKTQFSNRNTRKCLQ